MFSMILLSSLLVVGVVWLGGDRNSKKTARDLLEKATQERRIGNHEKAEEYAVAAIAEDPFQDEAVLVAARSAAAQHRYREALNYLERLRSDDRELVTEVAFLRAEWNFRHLANLSAAEEAYQDVLTLDPNHLQAHQGYVELMATCGRSREAIPSILRMIRQTPDDDAYILLLRDRGAIENLDLLEKARRNWPEDPVPLIGIAWNLAAEGNQEQALERLESAVALDPKNRAAQLALGRQLLHLGQYHRLLRWSQELPIKCGDHADFWILNGELSEHFDQPDAAIRCYWEASKRSPDLDRPVVRLIPLLQTEEKTSVSELFASRLQNLLSLNDAQNQMLIQTSNATSEDYLRLIHAYEKTGRIWEAWAWCRRALQMAPSNQGLQQRYAELQKRTESLPLQLTQVDANVALKVDLSSYPLPSFDSISLDKQPSAVRSHDSRTFAFHDESSMAGIQFRFVNGTLGEPTRRMFEFTGGGIGVLDYDQDGSPDLYFSQGLEWEDRGPNSPQDQLFRNVGGTHFREISSEASLKEREFGQGVAVGDIDSDGFPDLLIANIGPNRLWRNNGDGTFSDVTEEAGLFGEKWSTSCLIADLDHDGDADLYLANYLAGHDLFEKICQHSDGKAVACYPTHFKGELDDFWQNQGSWSFSDATETLFPKKPDGKGLGVVAWDADHSGQLSLFVANDTTPNLFYVPSHGSTKGFSEQGILSGVAVNSNGKAEGCMGIAVGDLDQNGRQDLHVTNFLAESNTLYRSFGGILFEDSTKAYGLQESTYDDLGFGTNFLDVDLNGSLELFVSNGHVDDLRRYGRPYRMQPKLFRLESDQYQTVAPDSLGNYFQNQWLGRASVTLDWNADHLDDLVVGHLEENYALLTNRTQTSGHFLILRLIGTSSHRDAIGTRVSVNSGEQHWYQQLVAGGSYQASSEKKLTFGLGDVERLDRLRVEWPSGLTQEFADLPVSRRYVLVEGKELLPESSR
ncbi:MAG: VCBS repeat-containing protein [Planctomycetaceae bacterium]|nr:VCBS repeat-containing protein [Planctomycetaceae bacterium]